MENGKLLSINTLLKSNQNFFSAQILDHLFSVVYFSFNTSYTWGGQYHLRKFSLDLDPYLRRVIRRSDEKIFPLLGIQSQVY